MCVCGVLFSSGGFGVTVVPDSGEVQDHFLVAPDSMLDNRPEALAWLVEEATRLFNNNDVTEVRLWAAAKPGRVSAGLDRYEVETCVQIGAFHAGVPVRLVDRRKLEAAFKSASGEKATLEELLGAPDVAGRPNKEKRQQYLAAKAPMP